MSIPSSIILILIYSSVVEERSNLDCSIQVHFGKELAIKVNQNLFNGIGHTKHLYAPRRCSSLNDLLMIDCVVRVVSCTKL